MNVTVSQSGSLTGRESEIIRILRVLSEATDGFVVIGGYAVNAHGQHRFSMDLDIATNKNNVPVIDTTLLTEGYTLRRDPVRPPIRMTMRVYRKSIGKVPVSVDLLVNTVVSRTTQGTWTYKFIQENSVEAIVVGATDSTPSKVAERNLLVAMKLHAGRTQDFGDVVMLSERVDWKTIAKSAACGSREKLLEQIDSAIRDISSPKFLSDLKSVFAMRSDPTRLIKRADRGLHSLTPLLAEEKFKDSL